MTAGLEVRIATWNLMWRSFAGTWGGFLGSTLEAAAADVWVLTEVSTAGPPRSVTAAHIVDGGTNWGYRVHRPDHRKVAMYSRRPWREVEHLDVGPASGRLVAATTETPIGDLRVIGVCIPWKDAHVANGKRDRRPWEEHLAFLDLLPEFIARQPRPHVMAGDFNQRIPNRSKDRHRLTAAERLTTILDGLAVATADKEPDLLDHIAHSAELDCVSAAIWSGDRDKHRVTDHWGAVAALRPTT